MPRPRPAGGAPGVAAGGGLLRGVAPPRLARRAFGAGAVPLPRSCAATLAAASLLAEFEPERGRRLFILLVKGF